MNGPECAKVLTYIGFTGVRFLTFLPMQDGRKSGPVEMRIECVAPDGAARGASMEYVPGVIDRLLEAVTT